MASMLTSFTMLLSLQNPFASLRTTSFTCMSGDNKGLCGVKFKKCHFEEELCAGKTQFAVGRVLAMTYGTVAIAAPPSFWNSGGNRR